MKYLPPDQQRRADLARIHIASKELGMDRDTYEAMLQTVAGVESSADLSAQGRRKVIGHLRQLGWKGKATRKQSDPQAKMILALWLSLHQQGIVRESSDTALSHFIQRNTGVARIEWLSASKANRVIEALKAMQQRAASQGEKST